MTVRFEKRKQGEMAVLPRAEYDKLIEDIGTMRIVARAKRAVAQGAPLIPIEVVDRIIAGENPVMVFREWRAMTQVQLAKASGVKQGYLSDIERGRRDGTAQTLRAFAKALNVPMDLLVTG